jgi:ABC-2 type transport system ATP-binding protein
MLGNPDIIILDEPTVGLDPKQIIEIRDLIRHLGHSRTVIISSHILSEISEICDEILVINGGELIASGTQQELQEKMGQGKVLHLVIRGECEGVLSVLAGIEGVGAPSVKDTDEQGTVTVDVSVSGDELRDAIFFAMAEHKYAVLTMELEEQSLEKIFLSLTNVASPAAAETVVDFEPVEDDEKTEEVAEETDETDHEEGER